MLLIDGVKYEEWVPKSEEEFEHIVSEHALEIFGEHSLYFDRKLKLQSLSGIGSIPDGYAIIIGDNYEWHIIEIELSSHPLYNHIVPQVSKFISGINNPSTRKTIIEAMYHALIRNKLNYSKMDKIIQTGEYYKFISDIVSNSPVITIIVEKDTPELHDALESLNHPRKNIVEFRTFTRERVGLSVHGHLFEPLYKYINVFDPLWEYSKETKREVGWKDEEYTLVHVEGDYEVYEKDGKFEVVILPNRSGRSTGYQSLEEAQRWIHRLKERKVTGEGKKEGKKRGAKGGRVTFAELVEAGLLQDGQVLYFYNTRLFTDERAQVVVSLDKLKYEGDGRTHSKSELASILLVKHGFQRGDYPSQGPKYWKTEDGKLLDDLNEQIRKRRGDRT